MAKTKWATVIAHQDLGQGVHRLECEADQDLGHVAGNYLIVRSDLPHPDKAGEVLRKAYSLATAPDASAPRRFALALLDVGEMSGWLAARRPGDRLEFSGPWGKRFRAQPGDPSGTVHLFATGTGWSPIGSMAFARLRRGEEGVFVWWQTNHLYDDRLMTLAQRQTVATGTDLAEKVPAEPSAMYFLAGDGAVILPLAQRLTAQGVPPGHVRTELFFNKPTKAP